MNDEARAELERVLRYDPNHVKAIRDLAGLYFTNGFQDLYKEYLMQLFTLDPLNDSVIEEAKKLGEYQLWSAVNDASESPQPSVESEPVIEEIEEEENVFVEPETEKIEVSDTVPIFPDKIDLSQFDNVEDDFTTILHGKLEYSRKVDQNLPEKDQDLADIAKDIINEQDVEDNTDSPPDIDHGRRSEIDLTAGDSDQHFTRDISQSSGTFTNEILRDKEQSNEDSLDSDELPDEEDDKFEQPKIISQTLGEILVSQQKYVEAKAVFEALKEKQPDNKALDLKIEYLNRIIGLEKKGKT